MNKFWLAGILLVLIASPLFALEKQIDHYRVILGLMPWENIVTEYHGEKSLFSAYQYRMAKEMAAMHGGGKTGDYHVLVVIKDTDTGNVIKDAKVNVAVSDKQSQSETAILENMNMEGFAGYGGYLRFNFNKPYTLRVSFSLQQDDKIREVEFSNQP